MFQGIAMRRGYPKLHHIFFTDDSLFFIKRTVENAQTLKSIIMDYCRASGQRINTAKSTLTFNRGTDENIVSAIVEELDIPQSATSAKYLDLPILGVD